MADDSVGYVRQAGGADRFRRSLHDTPASTAFTDVPCGVCPVCTLARRCVVVQIDRPCTRKAQPSVCEAPHMSFPRLTSRRTRVVASQLELEATKLFLCADRYFTTARRAVWFRRRRASTSTHGWTFECQIAAESSLKPRRTGLVTTDCVRHRVPSEASHPLRGRNIAHPHIVLQA